MPNPTIRVTSYAPSYRGWLRCPTDQTLPGAQGNTSQGHPWVDAGPAGADRRYVDLFVDVQAGIHQIDLTQEGPAPNVVPTLPDWTNGVVSPTICGVRANPWPGDCRPRGAAWEAHYVAQVRPNLWAHLFVWHYPDRRGWLEGEFWWSCGNAAMDILMADVPAVTIEWGGTVYLSILGSAGRSAFRMADGQTVVTPIMLMWGSAQVPKISGDFAAGAYHQVSAYGLRNLWPAGNPRLPTGQKALPWMRAKSDEVRRTLGTMAPLSIGPMPRSGATGAQADQVFVGGEIVAPDGGGAEMIYRLAAYRTGCRPCAHVEFTGELLRLDRHPDLRLWDGRTHHDPRVSPDRQGKTSQLTIEQASGWWGPDVEHSFHNLLFVAARANYSPALQWQLQALARVYLLQWTSAPGLSTSQPYAARAIGWECLLVEQIWNVLDDRSLAEAVRLRRAERWYDIIFPYLDANRRYVDVRRDDPRLGAGDWWLPWQVAVMCYGLWFANWAGMREYATRYARVIFEEAWREDPDGGWSSAPVAPVGPVPADKFDRSFNLFGMCLAVAVLKMAEPNNERAQRCWNWLVDQAGGGHPWLPPEAY